MSQKLRGEVFQAFKSLHRTRQYVFQGDDSALAKARNFINEEYKKCKDVQNQMAIKDLIKYSKDVENELKTTVIQAREVQPGRYEAKLRDEVIRFDNVPFKECT